jgi:uncharacterized protein
MMAEKTFLKDMLDAIRQEDIDKIDNLIEKDKECLYLMTIFGTWLHFSASEGKLQIVKYFIEKGLDVNIYCDEIPSDYTPINAASSNGNTEVVRYLISCGATFDVSTTIHSPLFSAIQKGHLEVVKLLIENGIDAKIKYNSKTMKNMDALAFAYERGQTDIITILRPYSLGEPTFWDGKGYVSPAVDNYYIMSGWREFDLQGNRLGIYKYNPTIKIKD